MHGRFYEINWLSMQAIKKTECVDVLSNVRQIDLGHKIAKA